MTGSVARRHVEEALRELTNDYQDAVAARDELQAARVLLTDAVSLVRRLLPFAARQASDDAILAEQFAEEFLGRLPARDPLAPDSDRHTVTIPVSLTGLPADASPHMLAEHLACTLRTDKSGYDAKAYTAQAKRTAAGVWGVNVTPGQRRTPK